MNNQLKHTPGPWAISDDRDYIIEAPKSDYVSICKWHVSDITQETDMANARLIAAAPELLEALIELNSTNSKANESYYRIRALIGKITGEGV